MKIAHSDHPAFNVAGVKIQFLATPEQVRDEISVMRGVVPAGVVIPLHRRPDPEIFYIADGSIEVFQAEGQNANWSTVTAGETVCIPGKVKHALRNTSSVAVTTLLITKNGIHQFFKALGQPFDPNQLPAPPTPAQTEQLIILAERYEYWMALTQENAAIGISLP